MTTKSPVTDSKKSSVIIASISAIVYLCLVAVGLFFHENWGDEVQQWLLVRDLDFPGLLSHLKGEGHMLPWYLIILPFAKLGFPLKTVNIISAVLVSAATGLILWKAPFEWYKKALFIFCPAMVYYFPVISRCYALVPLAIIFTALSYKNRHEKPMRFLLSLILLANTHMLMWGMVAAIASEYFFEFLGNTKNMSKDSVRKEVLAIVSAAVILLITLLPLIIGTNGNSTVTFELSKLGYVFESFLINSIHIFPLCFKIEMLGLLLVFVAILFFILEFIKIGKHTFTMLFSILFQLIIYACMYYTSEQKAMLFFMIVFYFHWVNRINPRPFAVLNKLSLKSVLSKANSVLAMALLIVSILNSFYFIFEMEMKQPYSNAPYLARYMEENIPDNSVILIGNEFYIAVSVQGYLSENSEIKFYDLIKQEYYTYVTWDDTNSQMTSKENLLNTIDQFDSSTNLYYLQSTSNISQNDEVSLVLSLVDDKILTPVYMASDSYYNEDYVLYRVNRKNKKPGNYSSASFFVSLIIKSAVLVPVFASFLRIRY